MDFVAGMAGRKNSWSAEVSAEPADGLLPGDQFPAAAKRCIRLLEPDAACSILELPETGCVCLVPGLAFDRNGYRLGYGGGYYDRFLQQHPQLIRVGYCPTACFTDSLPREKTDLPVQYLITDQTEEELYGSGT